MDRDADPDNGAEIQSSVCEITNEETGEVERNAFFQYRGSEEPIASDEESKGSGENASSDKSSRNSETHNGDNPINETSVTELLDSIPGFYDCDDKISCLFGIDRQNVLQESEDLATKLNEIFLFNEPCDSLISIENDSKKLEILPDVEVSNNSMLQENEQSPVHKSRIFYPDYRTQNLESAAEREESSSISLRSSTSQHSKRGRFCKSKMTNNCLFFSSSDPGISSTIPALSSKCINFLKAQSSQAHSNSNTSPRTDTHVPKSNSSSMSFHRLPNSPSTSFVFPLDIVRRNVARSWEHSYTSSPNIHYTQGDEKSNACLSPSDRDTTDACKSPNSDILDLDESFWEEHCTSIDDIFTVEEHQNSNEGNSNNKIRRKSISPLYDLPSTSKISPHPRSSQNLSHTPKSTLKLFFADSDTSSDDSKENYPAVKVKLVRKFSETTEPRKKRKTSHLTKSENHSMFRKTNNDEHTTENSHFSQSSEIVEVKSSHPKESKSVSILSSSGTINSEASEACQSTRKRLISDAKASDSDESDVKSKKKKKLKPCDSSDNEK